MALEFEFSIEDLEAAEAATANRYLSDPAKGLQLLSRLVGEPCQDSAALSERLAGLHHLIHHDFIQLAGKGSYPGEAQALRELLALQESVENLALFPDLANKTIVGVGGGFSAGKSRFINTLLGVDLLPEALEPTTAIPSFISQGATGIIALNSFNHQVALDLDALHAITHAFKTHYQENLGDTFGFAHLIKLLMLHHPEFAWDNLAFIDTPGYSKAEASGAKLTDERIALKQLNESDHLIWLLSAKNGSIRLDDLEFLRNLSHPKPIFFVVTQADLVGPTRVDAILQSTSEAIDAAGLPCAGLMAWAAPLGYEQGEYVAGDDIREWLDQLDSTPKYTSHRRICENVLNGYIRHHQDNLTGSRKKLSLLNAMLPLTGELPESEQATLRELLQENRRQQKVFTDLANEFAELKNGMQAAIGLIVGNVAVDAPSAQELHSKGLTYHGKGQFDCAFAHFQQAADLGELDAQFQLGTYYELGLGVGVNERRAVTYYRQAAEQNHAGAQFYLGVCYDNGEGVTVDKSIAFSWYLKAADQGYPDAQHNLGVCYAKGEGVLADDQKAVHWYQKAAEQGHLKARVNILKRAYQGSNDAQYALGVIYESGQGVSKDIDVAISWYRRAADAGHAAAQYEIGRRYWHGDGLRKNSAHANSWLEKAAAQKNIDAIALIAELRPAFPAAMFAQTFKSSNFFSSLWNK